eukprot:scaffold4297_cov103-Isochrysis_galbana.AAC.4
MSRPTLGPTVGRYRRAPQAQRAPARRRSRRPLRIARRRFEGMCSLLCRSPRRRPAPCGVARARWRCASARASRAAKSNRRRAASHRGGSRRAESRSGVGSPSSAA